MISVIICSINPVLLSRLQENIAVTIGVEHEVIVIDNLLKKYSLAQAYNEGATQARYGFLCFIHEDIIFHTQNWGQNLANHLSDTNVSLLGILGNVIKTKCPSGAYSTVHEVLRINHLQRTLSQEQEFYNKNPYSEHESDVAVLDGMFLATTISQHHRYPFDERLLNGFHGYDVDYSLGHFFNGRIIVVYDILIEHLSFGNYSKEWIDAQLLVTKKWEERLPLSINGYEKYLKKLEFENIRQFLTLLFKLNCEKKMQICFALKSVKINLRSCYNLYYLRKITVYGKFESFLKAFLS